MFVYRTKFPPIIGDKKCRLREQSFSFREHNLQFSDWDKKHYKPIYSKGLKDFKIWKYQSLLGCLQSNNFKICLKKQLYLYLVF